MATLMIQQFDSSMPSSELYSNAPEMLTGGGADSPEPSRSMPSIVTTRAVGQLDPPYPVADKHMSQLRPSAMLFVLRSVHFRVSGWQYMPVVGTVPSGSSGAAA